MPRPRTSQVLLRESRDHSGRRDLANCLVAVVGDVQVAGSVERAADRIAESRSASRAIDESRASARPASVVTTPSRRDPAHGVSGEVDDVDRARCVDRDAARRLNRAALPVPSALPTVSARPASVVTMPAGVISADSCWLGVRHVEVAAGIDRDALRTVEARHDSGTVGIAHALASPASVLTTPAGVILRIVLLSLSAT